MDGGVVAVVPGEGREGLDGAPALGMERVWVNGDGHVGLEAGFGVFGRKALRHEVPDEGALRRKGA